MQDTPTPPTANTLPAVRKPYPGVRGIIEEGSLADLILTVELATEGREAELPRDKAEPPAPSGTTLPFRRRAPYRLPRPPRPAFPYGW